MSKEKSFHLNPPKILTQSKISIFKIQVMKRCFNNLNASHVDKFLNLDIKSISLSNRYYMDWKIKNRNSLMKQNAIAYDMPHTDIIEKLLKEALIRMKKIPIFICSLYISPLFTHDNVVQTKTSFILEGSF